MKNKPCPEQVKNIQLLVTGQDLKMTLQQLKQSVFKYSREMRHCKLEVFVMALARESGAICS